VLLPKGFSRVVEQKITARIPMGRHGAPDDVTEAVCFFAICPRYITG